MAPRWSTLLVRGKVTVGLAKRRNSPGSHREARKGKELSWVDDDLCPLSGPYHATPLAAAGETTTQRQDPVGEEIA